MIKKNAVFGDGILFCIYRFITENCGIQQLVFAEVIKLPFNINEVPDLASNLNEILEQCVLLTGRSGPNRVRTDPDTAADDQNQKKQPAKENMRFHPKS